MLCPRRHGRFQEDFSGFATTWFKEARASGRIVFGSATAVQGRPCHDRYATINSWDSNMHFTVCLEQS